MVSEKKDESLAYGACGTTDTCCINMNEVSAAHTALLHRLGRHGEVLSFRFSNTVLFLYCSPGSFMNTIKHQNSPVRMMCNNNSVADIRLNSHPELFRVTEGNKNLKESLQHLPLERLFNNESSTAIAEMRNS